jgi:AcrR family transcriptional regulator
VFTEPGSLGKPRPGPRAEGSASADLHRERIVSSLVHVMAEKGYAATTVAEITARAQVSRRTFYEHFADKNACLTAAYDTTSLFLFDLVRSQVESKRSGLRAERLTAGFTTFFRGISYAPEIARTFLTEHTGAGEDAFRHAQAIKQMWAGYLREQVVLACEEDPVLAQAATPPSNEIAMAFIGSVYELSVMSLEPDSPYTVEQMVDSAATMFLALNIRGVDRFARVILAAGRGAPGSEERTAAERQIARALQDVRGS